MPNPTNPEVSIMSSSLDSISIIEQLKSNRFVKADYLLFIALMLFAFVPSINQLIVDHLISGLENNLLNVAGQIEWFDLFNETLLAFLIVPLYFVFNKVANDDGRLRSRITQTFAVGLVLYTIVSVFIYVYASSLSSYMDAPGESLAYLRLETIGFVLGFVSSFIYVIFVVRGRWRYVLFLLMAKVSILSIGNMILIPEHGVMGIAMTNIVTNIALLIVSSLLLHKEGLLQFKIRFDKLTMKDWTRTGMFSGSQIFLDNLVYMVIIVKMVNEVSSVGIYWLANNFIWGWLLIPIVALSEIAKRDYYNGYRRIYNYLVLVAVIAFAWLLSVPLWDVMFTDVVQAQDPGGVLEILYLLVPFYVAYAVAAVFDGILTSVGKTWYLLGISLVVNIGYYGLVYSMFLGGWFTASIPFIISMFGFGMVVHMALSIVFYLHSRRQAFPRRTDVGHYGD